MTNLTNRIADCNYCVYECGKLLITTLSDCKNKIKLKLKLEIQLLNKCGVGSPASNIIYYNRNIQSYTSSQVLMINNHGPLSVNSLHKICNIPLKLN